MRYTPTLKLSTRLVAFVTVIVISAMFILFIGGTLSFKRIGQEYLDHSLNGIVEVIDKELEDPDAAYQMQRWVPKLLQASNILEMQLSSPVGVVYRFKNTEMKIEPGRTYSAAYPLERNTGYTVTMTSVPPYYSTSYSMEALWSISLSIGLVIFCLLRGLQWLKEQLSGSEMLEERGRMILAGKVEEFAKGDYKEWPYTASEALDVLIEELQDARQERSRFDTFIRSQTFLDQLTGTANRVLFDSKLESALHESGSHGGVMFIRIDDWSMALEENTKQECDGFIVEVGKALSSIVQRYPDVILSRYYKADFAVFIPHQSSKDIANLATQCLRQLEKVTPIEPLDADNWCHIGISMYHENESASRVVDEAETALKSAQLQRVNTWSRFKKEMIEASERGSVRWRTILDRAFMPSNLLVYKQSCYLNNDDGKVQHPLHYEVFGRIDDPERGRLKASHFMAAVEMVGYQSNMDKAVLSQLIEYLKHSSDPSRYSINLHITPFKNKWYIRWLRDELLQLPRELRHRLSFEFTESGLVQHLDYMRPVIKVLSGLGVSIVVDQAGRTITSTHYIKDLKVDYLKLHRSLIKKIDLRNENQLFVRSMLGACADLDTKVIAVGVENEYEWKVLLSLGVQGGQGRFFDAEICMLPDPQSLSEPIPSKVKIGRRNRWRK